MQEEATYRLHTLKRGLYLGTEAAVFCLKMSQCELSPLCLLTQVLFA